MAVEILHLSSILKSPVVDRKGERLGRVQDLIVRLGQAPHPPLSGLVVRIARRAMFVPIHQVAAISPGRVELVGETVNLGRFDRRPGEMLLARDLMARHIINLSGARLIRANEIEIARLEGRWEVVGVDPSSRVALRRL
ncbi:MAG: magnesium transporter MgtE N-terminal domain-containing protein, partial [Acidimicrobiales bacterium]